MVTKTSAMLTCNQTAERPKSTGPPLRTKCHRGVEDEKVALPHVLLKPEESVHCVDCACFGDELAKQRKVPTAEGYRTHPNVTVLEDEKLVFLKRSKTG